MTMIMAMIMNGHLLEDVRANLNNKKALIVHPSAFSPQDPGLRPQASSFMAHDYDYDYDDDYDYDYDHDSDYDYDYVYDYATSYNY